MWWLEYFVLVILFVFVVHPTSWVGEIFSALGCSDVETVLRIFSVYCAEHF
jgi:hypothetical protein